MIGGVARPAAWPLAGLAIERVDGTTVAEWIDVARLIALAELEGVERIVPAATR